MRRNNLPLNNKYTFMSISDIGETSQTCDNCGKPIRYVAHLKDSNNKNYYVGTECAKTLSVCDITNEYEMLEEFNAIKKSSEIRNFVTNGKEIKIFGYKDNYVIVVGKTLKGITKKMKLDKMYNLHGNVFSSISDTIDYINKNYYVENHFCFNDIFKYFDYLKRKVD